MKVAIRNEPYQSGIGGSECLVAVMAEVLSTLHDVEIVHHHPTLELSSLAAFSGTTLDSVRFRYVPPEPFESPKTHNLWRLFNAARDWHAELSRPYDLFINVTHGIPPFSHARQGMLLLLFPNYRRSHAWPLTAGAGDGSNRLRQRLRDWYYDWEWRRRIGTYQTRLAISEYSRKWTLAYWGMDSRVLYPPVDTRFAITSKVNRIVSVGRFSTLGHKKHHALMLKTFASLVEARRGGWQYSCFGGVGKLPADRLYFESMRDLGVTCGADVISNVDRDRLVDTYEQAKVFWHAAGFGENELERPADAEHFGIATVEAMAAGCVPVVINKGGQPEIVEHGVSGFLWNTPDELAEHTQRLILDDQLRAQMSAAARARAAVFSRERFSERFLELVDRVRIPRQRARFSRAHTHSERSSIRATAFKDKERCDPVSGERPKDSRGRRGDNHDNPSGVIRRSNPVEAEDVYMNAKIHVTVAICTWNRCALLRETLAQITKIVVPPEVTWDLLVINNRCTDATDDVIDAFKDVLPIRRLFEPKPGQSNARNLALSEARGDYILWTDDDVLVSESWLSAFVETARNYPDAAIIGGPVDPWFRATPDPAVIAAFPIVAIGFCGVDHRLAEGPLPSQLYISGANMGLRKAAVAGLVFDTGLGHSPASFRAGEDYEFINRIRERGGVVMWSPRMQVQHYVDPSRVTRKYLKKYAIGLGENWIRDIGVPPGPRVFGAPRWLWKQCLESYVQYGVARLLPFRDNTFVRLRDHYRLRGAVRECRALSRGVAGDGAPSPLRYHGR